MDKTLKAQIRNLISNAKTDQALDAFIQWANTSGSDLGNDLIGLKAQYSSLKRNENLGLISFSEANIKRAQISNGVLQILESADDSVQQPSILIQTDTRTIVSGNADSTTKLRKTILFMGANPPGTKYLQLEIEHSRIATKVGNKCNLETEKFLNAGDIPELISKYNPNIIHFSGHGKDPVTGESGTTSDNSRGIGYALPAGYEQQGGIVVFDDDMRGMRIIDDDSLAYLFDATVNDLKVPLEVVVFNSCYSESQAKAIGKFVPYVVGSAYALDDNLALAFAEGFYFGISNDNTIEKAFVTGKINVVLRKSKAKDLIVLYKNGVKLDL